MPFETTRLSGKLSKVNAQEAMRYLNAVSQDPEGMPEKAPEISSEDTPSEKAKKEQDVAAIKSIKDFCGGALEYTFITNRRGAAVYVFEEKEAKEVKNEKTNETEVIKVTKGLILVFVADVRVLHGTEVLPGSFNLHNNLEKYAAGAKFKLHPKAKSALQMLWDGTQQGTSKVKGLGAFIKEFVNENSSSKAGGPTGQDDVRIKAMASGVGGALLQCFLSKILSPKQLGLGQRLWRKVGGSSHLTGISPDFVFLLDPVPILSPMKAEFLTNSLGPKLFTVINDGGLYDLNEKLFTCFLPGNISRFPVGGRDDVSPEYQSSLARYEDNINNHWLMSNFVSFIERSFPGLSTYQWFENAWKIVVDLISTAATGGGAYFLMAHLLESSAFETMLFIMLSSAGGYAGNARVIELIVSYFSDGISKKDVSDNYGKFSKDGGIALASGVVALLTYTRTSGTAWLSWDPKSEAFRALALFVLASSGLLGELGKRCIGPVLKSRAAREEFEEEFSRAKKMI